MSSSPSISSSIHKVLSNFPTNLIGEGLEDHPTRETIETELPSQIQSVISDENLEIKSSVGKGRFTAIPWVALLDERIAESINEGVYVVYLFEPTQGRVSLTLNQGVKKIRESEGMTSARERLRSRAREIREYLNLPDFTKDELEFPDSSSRTELYGPGTIAYKRYELGDIPDEDQIIHDLQQIVEAYRYIVAKLEESDQLPPSVESYSTVSEAMDDITARLEISEVSNWLDDELTKTVIEDWSEVLTNFGPDSIVTPLEEGRLEQIRSLYENNESRFRTDAARIGSGHLKQITKPQTLFVAFLRELQEQAGLTTNANQVKVKIILDERYDVRIGEIEDDDQDDLTHPLLAHLDTQSAARPVRKFTAPPEYWLTAVRFGTVSFENDHRDAWEAVETGDVVLLHSRSEPGTEGLDTQPSGLIGVGVLGEKSTKDEQWWTDESPDEPFPYLVHFNRLFLTSNLGELDIATPVDERSTEELEVALRSLTAELLEFGRVQSICEETNGIKFPAQGAHAIFRNAAGDPDRERPRALLEAMGDRLQEIGTVNAHKSFDGPLSTDPFEELYYPDGELQAIVEQIESALRTGKHVVLTGPPGTGKTEIARRICSYLAREYPHLYSDFQLTTATADWSTFDTVGGYMPEESEEDGEDLSFNPGVVLNRFKERRNDRQLNEPIVIDELNRADIDKAFGQLFTLLSGQSVQLPYTKDGQEIELLAAEDIDHHPKSHQYVVPESWRIFATMNTYDKTSLYEMSYAFMRRFAFIRVGVPDLPDEDDQLEALMFEYAGVWGLDPERDEATEVGRVWRAMNQAVDDRAIGPAIVQDILSYVMEDGGPDLDKRLTRAVISYIFAQLEGVPKREQILREIAKVDRVERDMLDEAATEMLQVNLRSNE